MSTSLSEAEERVVSECLSAAAAGSFFEDAEFETVLGVTRHEMKSVARDWPAVDFLDEVVQACVHAALLNVVAYPHHVTGSEWARHISVPPDEVHRILRKWVDAGSAK
jgi:hypothetical protein